MNKRGILAILLIACLFAGSGCTPASRVAETTPAPGEIVSVTLLHVNDSHGRTEPHLFKHQSVGGYSRVATLVADVRRSSKTRGVFLVHAGDIFSRGDSLTRRTLGAGNVALMNHLDFDFWTPGNGEFYDGVPNLRKRIAEARFDVLTSNVKLKESGQYLGRPYVITNAGPVSIAFFGLCFVRMDPHLEGFLTVEDPIETARKLVPYLRERTDAVVAVTHIGRHEDHRLATTVPGIDLIVGGHSHAAFPSGKTVKGPDGRDVLIVHAGDQLRLLGNVDLKFRGGAKGYVVIEATAGLIRVDAKIPEDPKVKSLIAKLNEASTQPATAAIAK